MAVEKTLVKKVATKKPKPNPVPVPVISIDGPSGSGKGTINQKLTKKLGWHLLDSGALYRTLAVCAADKNIDFSDPEALSRFADSLDISFIPSSKKNDPVDVIVNGKNITSDVRTEHAGMLAAKIAPLKAVRDALFNKQKEARKAPGLIADGRDMGTVVFPDAIIKFFITASPQERAKRRYKQLQDNGVDVKLAALVNELADRDVKDRERKLSPLRPADDAVLIDTTDLNIDEVMDVVDKIVDEKLGAVA